MGFGVMKMVRVDYLFKKKKKGLGGSFIALFPEVLFAGTAQMSPSPYSRL